MLPTSKDKLREYQSLWLSIASADADTQVKVKCAATFARRLIQAVRKEKSLANNTRKTLDMPRYGKLFSQITKVDNHKVLVCFSLSYNGDQL